jgi:hypothetical protein
MLTLRMLKLKLIWTAAIMYEDAETNNDNDVPNLLAYMAWQQSSSGDICQVLAARQAPDKQKKRQVNESTSAPPTLTMNGDTYYLHKGEIIHYQGHQYFSHVTNCHHRVGQHDVGDMEYALVDRGANGDICGTDMLVIEGSERFVDVIGLAGHKVSQLRIVTGTCICPQGGCYCHIPPNGFAWKRQEYSILPTYGSPWCKHQ